MRVPLPEPPTVGALLLDPDLAALPGDLLVAVNLALVDRDTVLKDGDEVVMMPPVSGG
jgi:molybdopterin converting factor small subunit